MSASQLSGTSASGKPEYIEETDLSNEESSFEDEDEKAAGESSLVPMIIGGVGFLAVVVVGIVLCVCLCQKDDAEVTPAPSTTEKEVKTEEEIATPGEVDSDNLTRMERSKRSFSNASTTIKDAPSKSKDGLVNSKNTVLKTRGNMLKFFGGFIGMVLGLGVVALGIFGSSHIPKIGGAGATADKVRVGSVIAAGAVISLASAGCAYKKMEGLAAPNGDSEDKVKEAGAEETQEKDKAV